MPYKDKEKMKAYKKVYYESNKEKQKAYIKAWRKANKEKMKASDKAYYEANKEKKKAYRKANKEKMKAYKKVYKKNNRGLFNAYNSKRQADKIMATPSWANLEKIKEIYKNCPEGYHVDHIYPLRSKYVCGLHVENNLQYLTATENLQKSNKIIDKYL
jgi:leucyl aminopeptidase (aminopeptidase T)|tara:strand:+ start:2136 stop:2609 length:474 start_codon:yes stop_codon:yes gene_type:complete